MKPLDVTMKIYPITERKNGDHWSESQKRRMLTIRIMNGDEKPSVDMANFFHKEMLKFGYAAIDFNTHTKIVGIEDLHEEQVKLHKLFNLILTS